ADVVEQPEDGGVGIGVGWVDVQRDYQPWLGRQEVAAGQLAGQQGVEAGACGGLLQQLADLEGTGSPSAARARDADVEPCRGRRIGDEGFAGEGEVLPGHRGSLARGLPAAAMAPGTAPRGVVVGMSGPA